jgi:NAD(P)-dependent dehydrogenase (short-subunit alcohol dehydrogenase family)
VKLSGSKGLISVLAPKVFQLNRTMSVRSNSDLKLVDGDIGLPETAQLVVATAMRDFGRIDLLVNNAGVFIPKPFTDYRNSQVQRGEMSLHFPKAFAGAPSSFARSCTPPLPVLFGTPSRAPEGGHHSRRAERP